MRSLIRDVAEFHAACDVPVHTRPHIPPQDREDLRASLCEEEMLRELIPALRAKKLTAIADAIGDSIYVLVGTAIEYGIPLDIVWYHIQNANMGKVDPATGKVIKRADGKVLKPDGWEATHKPDPKIRAMLLSLGADINEV